MVNPYKIEPIDGSLDIYATPEHLAGADDFKLEREHVVDPSNRSAFGRGLTNLPNAKKKRTAG